VVCKHSPSPIVTERDMASTSIPPEEKRWKMNVTEDAVRFEHYVRFRSIQGIPINTTSETIEPADTL
jgi:hypothetical protein